MQTYAEERSTVPPQKGEAEGSGRRHDRHRLKRRMAGIIGLAACTRVGLGRGESEHQFIQPEPSLEAAAAGKAKVGPAREGQCNKTVLTWYGLPASLRNGQPPPTVPLGDRLG